MNRNNDKTSTSPNTSLDQALERIHIPEELSEGVPFIKLNSTGKTRNRFLTLSRDRLKLYITSSKLKNGIAPSNLLQKPFLNRYFSAGSGSPDENDDGDLNGKVIDVGSIDRVQTGQNTKQFEHYRAQKTSAFLEQIEKESLLSFSIMYRGERSVALITNSEEDFNIIIRTLDILVDTYNKASLSLGKDVMLLRYIWSDMDKDRSGSLNVNKLGNVLNRINYAMSKKDVETNYKKFCKKIGIKKKHGLEFDQAVQFLHMIKRDTWQVKPVNGIWNEVFGNLRTTGEIRVKVNKLAFLQLFLQDEQGQYDATIEGVRSIFERLNNLELPKLKTDISNGGDQYIDKSRFEAYLLSRENDIFDPLKEAHDPASMCEPLSHYWISSSHNTYLLGDQLQSQSSVEMYLTALHRGCRCVEIDCHNGERVDHKPVPIVYHGHTITSKILFVDVLRVINNFLETNPNSYPIIISLENHCSAEYQEVMAEQLLTTFGEKLYIPNEGFDNFTDLPSPRSLKGKIILKGHKRISDEEASASSIETDEDCDESQALRGSDFQSRSPRATKTCSSLSRLTFFHSTNFEDFTKSFMMKPFEMHSFSEDKIRTHALDSRRNCIIYNQSHMSRVYPGGIRLGSSNYNPLQAWAIGCHLVALNFQTADAPLRMNDGRFRVNGGCGFVLKPQNMCQDRFIEQLASSPISLSIRVFGASCLPKPKGQRRGECIDPFVKVTLWDVHARDYSEIKIDHTTRSVASNGYFPIWNDQTAKFRFNVQSQHVAMLQFTVWDRDVGNNDFIASAAIPISCMRKGYRSVQLFDKNNTMSGLFELANLLVHVDFERTVEEI